MWHCQSQLSGYQIDFPDFDVHYYLKLRGAFRVTSSWILLPWKLIVDLQDLDLTSTLLEDLSQCSIIYPPWIL